MRSLLGSIGIALVVAGCQIPTIPVTTPLRPHDIFTVGGTLRVQVYQCWDSTAFAHTRYIPVFLFRPAAPSAPLYVAARQEYLSRFAGPLRPAQKELLQTVLEPHPSDSLAQWRVPVYDGEVSDLRHITPVRNAYWSIERYQQGKVREIAALWLRSYPQTEPWDWRHRAPDFWHQLRQEALAIYPELRRQVQRDLEHHVLNAPLAP